MKTADLVPGPQTDALVALAWPEEDERFGVVASLPSVRIPPQVYENGDTYSPSTTRAQWAELLILYNMEITYGYLDGKELLRGARAMGKDGMFSSWLYANELGLAVCKALIASKWGDTIPAAIWEKVK